MNRKNELIVNILNQIELVLRRYDMWQSEPPSLAALTSVEPFAVDTLTCEEWLQWIFIPKFHEMIDAEQELPIGFAISAYVEETMLGSDGGKKVYQLCVELDEIARVIH
ncbi:MAG: YqcC family protein [Aliivibrio sp.]|uniref:YqcC family protein n=1 Tax=Aliivibrio sp. TaxID=1872443 RepID=UPI001A497C1E|nr:YqcC family protein [Aliivibrio sp.]